MAKVKALHEIHRAKGVVKAGEIFTVTGEELEYLRKVGAVSNDLEDGPVEVEGTVEPKVTKKAGKADTAAASGDDLGLE